MGFRFFPKNREDPNNLEITKVDMKNFIFLEGFQPSTWKKIPRYLKPPKIPFMVRVGMFVHIC